MLLASSIWSPLLVSLTPWVSALNRRGYHVREEGILPHSDSDFFSLSGKNFPPCFLLALHYTFPRKWQHMHPYRPLLYAFFRLDEKNFNWLKKLAKILWKYSHIPEIVNQTNSYFKIRKWYDILRSNVKSKWQKLRHRGCANFVENSMQIRKPT